MLDKSSLEAEAAFGEDLGVKDEQKKNAVLEEVGRSEKREEVR